VDDHLRTTAPPRSSWGAWLRALPPDGTKKTLLVACAVAIVLSGLNLYAPVRPSHMLRLRVTPEVDFERAFADIFGAYLDRTQLVSVETVQAGMLTELNYAVRLRADARAHDLVLALQQANGNNRVILTTAMFDAERDGGDD
jgi:hypothetical protein